MNLYFFSFFLHDCNGSHSSLWQNIFKALAADLRGLWAGFGDRQQLVSKRGQTAMIYSQTHLTGERPHDYLFPLNSHMHCVLFRRPPPLPVNTHTRTHQRARVSFHPPHPTTPPLQELFMSEWLGLCVCGPPCPLKRALINDYFINQEVLAGLKRLWGQGSAEVLNQFPIPGWLDIFCFLAARRFIIILSWRHNGRGMAGELDVGGKRGWGGSRRAGGVKKGKMEK